MKISIITITFNSERTIEQTILSILGQEYDDLEYIIVDGKSSDSTLKIINKYRKHISKIISECDNGISDAFNKGIRMATGDIVGIINSDDFLEKNALKALNAFVMQHQCFDVYYGNTIMFYDDSMKNYVLSPKDNIKNLKMYMMLSHPGTFIKREAYEKYGVYETEYKCAMDFELLSRFYLGGAKFIYFDCEMTWFRFGGESFKKRNLTKAESIKIAIRNGCDPKETKKWYDYVYKKQNITAFLKNIGAENIFRFVFNKQRSSKSDSNWYEPYSNIDGGI